MADDRPKTCGYGHEIKPGRSFIGGWTKCFDECGGPAHGHHHIYCGLDCDAYMWVGHVGAVWMSRRTREPISPAAPG